MESRSPSILLGIHREDPKKLLSDYDYLLGRGCNYIHASEKDDRYMIEFPGLYNWATTLSPYSKLDDIQFSLCNPEGDIIGAINKTTQYLLRQGHDYTFINCSSTVNYGYKVFSSFSIQVETKELIFPAITIEQFQHILEHKESLGDNSLQDTIFGYKMTLFRPMIFDMHNKGYITLSDIQLLEWQLKDCLGL